jgi:FG-GAP repeat
LATQILEARESEEQNRDEPHDPEAATLGRRASFRASGSAVLLACVGVALALGAVASSASSPLSFARASYFAGESPRSATVGDLNGDGKPDLAIADEDEDSVAVLLNRATAASSPGSITRAGDNLSRSRSAN